MKSFAALSLMAMLTGNTSAQQVVTDNKLTDHHAVLVAGSNGFWNYRHQADICHAYQLLIKQGMPAENIVTMAYDDIASDSQNPFPGQVFNKPTAAGVPGNDVYKGCQIDYKGKQVTPENFLAVLEGNAKTAGGKVLKSTANSKVFINFADHGAPGLIAFPDGEVYADQLHKTFQKMYASKMYKEMVVYIEACESGSMFENILTDKLNIYAVTAANSKESSWGTYCSPNDMVNGKHINSCLGDLFSVNWMENSEANNAKVETLKTQFTQVQSETTKSHVMNFGTTALESQPIGNFQGNDNISQDSASMLQKVFESRQLEAVPSSSEEQRTRHMSTVSSRDAKLHHFMSKIIHGDPKHQHKSQLLAQNELTKRLYMDHVFEQYIAGNESNEPVLPTKFECLREMVSTFKTYCGALEDYSLKFVQYLVNDCEAQPAGSSMAPLVQKLRKHCSED